MDALKVDSCSSSSQNFSKLRYQDTEGLSFKLKLT